MERLLKNLYDPKIQLQSRGSMTQNNGLTRIALFASLISRGGCRSP